MSPEQIAEAKARLLHYIKFCLTDYKDHLPGTVDLAQLITALEALEKMEQK